MNSDSYNKLRQAVSLQDLAKVLGFSSSGLAYILYAMGKKDSTTRYQTFQVKKKNGGVREIKAPCSQLKSLQEKLSKLLYICLQEINKQNNLNQSYSFAYQPNKTHYNNANIHKNKRYVFNIDLKDFFRSINFGRVRGYFLNNEYFKLDPKIATIIAQIACDDNSLPQGSPCSPIISHFISNILDYRLSQLAKKAKCYYSRYCDDITFSTNQKEFPNIIAKPKDNIWCVGDELRNIIERAGFKINDDKVRMSYRPSQQSVTGLVVNKRVNTSRYYRDAIRAMVHSLTRTGDFNFTKEFARDKRTVENKLNCLQGMLCYIRHVDNLSDGIAHKKLKNFKVLRAFILYRYFFANEKVVLFGEGKTDIFHLKHYLNYRDKETMYGIPKENELLEQWRELKLLRLDSKIFDPISQDGGTGDIKNLITGYKKECNKFFVPKSQNPVIILVDNDMGVTELFTSIKQMTKSKEDVDGSKDFYHIAYNLYVVALPKLNNKDTAIENFYSEDIRKIKYLDKDFSQDNGYDSKTQYGKNIFATKIIPHNYTMVDWSNFDQIFDRIQAVIDDFNGRKLKNNASLK